MGNKAVTKLSWIIMQPSENNNLSTRLPTLPAR
jgi:hypothetical protein